MSRHRKATYLAVMALGGAILAVDRFVLSDGTTQPAVALAGNPLAATASSSPAQTPAGMPIPELPFPRGLEPFDPDAPMRDLFEPPASALDGDPSADKDRLLLGLNERPERMNSAMFVARHRLGGVLVHERLRIAVVDGVWLRTGQAVDGCTLADISGDEVRFECLDGEAVLKMTDTRTLIRD